MTVLVDASVWIDHFHRTDAVLVDLLGRDEVACHPLVAQELALGALAARAVTIRSLLHLRQLPSLKPEEVLALVEAHRLWGRGLSAVDAHLLGAVRIVPGARLWTRDKRLQAAAADLQVTLHA